MGSRGSIQLKEQEEFLSQIIKYINKKFKLSNELEFELLDILASI